MFFVGNFAKTLLKTKEIKLTDCTEEQMAEDIAAILEARSTQKWGETFIRFNNEWGHGEINTYTFDWGITYLHWNVHFAQQTFLKLRVTEQAPIDFIFLNEGSVEFQTETLSKTQLNTYQNIIIKYKPKSENTFIFKKNENVQITFIQIVPEKYLNKRNPNVEFLHERMRKLFSASLDELYNHFGSDNLNIADQINAINHNPHKGIIRTLHMEGHLNIILGLQLLEHETYINNDGIPEILNQVEIEKIEKACHIIRNHISEKISVSSLARMVLLPQDKLQLGFKLLHNKTVNEYIKETKLLKACEYLKNGHDSVSEIVYKVGFNSKSYFSRIFNDRFGMLPNQYRKKLK